MSAYGSVTKPRGDAAPLPEGDPPVKKMEPGAAFPAPPETRDGFWNSPWKLGTVGAAVVGTVFALTKMRK